MQKRTIVHDAASLAPEVDIVPLKGKNNDLKINFYPFCRQRSRANLR